MSNYYVLRGVLSTSVVLRVLFNLKMLFYICTIIIPFFIHEENEMQKC